MFLATIRSTKVKYSVYVEVLKNSNWMEKKYFVVLKKRFYKQICLVTHYSLFIFCVVDNINKFGKCKSSII